MSFHRSSLPSGIKQNGISEIIYNALDYSFYMPLFACYFNISVYIDGGLCSVFEYMV